MEMLWQDVRHGLRMLARRPLLSAAIILTLGLGIGGTTAIFSVFEGIMLRDLIYENAEEVVVLWQTDLKTGEREGKVSAANFLDWQRESRSFRGMAAAEAFGFDLTGGGEPERARAWLVTPEFFRFLGVDMAQGRTFSPEEAASGAKLAVVGFGLWQRRFGSDPGLVGRTILLSGDPFTVIGILPREFQFPGAGDIWVPKVFRTDEKLNRSRTFLNVIALLQPGSAPEQAQRGMDTVAAQLASTYPETNSGRGIRIVPLREQLVGQVKPALTSLLGAVGLMLLLTYANVSNLLLLRGFERRRELASRAAFGATPKRLVSQLLTENLLFSLLGGVLGVLLAVGSVGLMRNLGPDLPRMDEVVINGRVFAFAFALSLLSALFFSMVAIRQISQNSIRHLIGDGGTTTTGVKRWRISNSIVAFEIALALVLLIGTGLLLRSFVRLLSVDPGFKNPNGIALEVHVWSKYHSPQAQAAFFSAAVEHLSSLPGVAAASAVSSLPFIENPIDKITHFEIAGRQAQTTAEMPSAYITSVTPGYFDTMQIPVLQGRDFTSFDEADSQPVAVVNQILARRYWPGESPIGRQISGSPRNIEIVGVVGDVLHDGLEREQRAELFIPNAQSPTGSMTFVLRPAGAPGPLLQNAKEALWSINRDLAFSSTPTLRQLIANSLRTRRFSLLLSASFAFIGLILAGTGIYASVSAAVNQSVRTIGIHMALGAQIRHILAGVLGTSLGAIFLGLLGGAALALSSTRFLASLLYGVESSDPSTFVGMAAVLMVVALLACGIPARRAIRVDPMLTLRE